MIKSKKTKAIFNVNKNQHLFQRITGALEQGKCDCHKKNEPLEGFVFKHFFMQTTKTMNTEQQGQS